MCPCCDRGYAMVAKLRSWLQTARKHLIVIVFIVLIGMFVLIFLGYWFDWDWTGFNERIGLQAQQYQPAKTLWDWLQLLGILAIPLVIGLGTAWFTTKYVQVSDAVNKDNQRETALQSYIDKMSELLLEKHLRESKPEDEVRKIGRVHTLTVLHRLDSERKRSVLQFLYESDLIVKGNSFINLDGAELSGANLVGANLGAADLGAANLSRADLREASLREADLTRVDLTRANLTGADLAGAKVTSQQLDQAKSLKGANMPDGTIYLDKPLSGS